MEIWEIRSNPSLSLLPGQLKPEVVAPDKIQSMGKIEQTMCANQRIVTVIYQYMKKFNCVQKGAQDRYKMCLQLIYIFNTCDIL